MRYNASITGAFTGRLTSFLGGMVFKKNGTASTYTTPTNPQTASQTEIRNAFKVLTEAWKGLTAGQRTAWSAAWSGGTWLTQDPFTGTSRAYQSPKSLFINVNMNLLISNNLLAAPAVQLASPPAQVAQEVIGLTSFIFDASAGTAALIYTGVLVNGAILVRVTPPLSPGNMVLTSVRSKLRSLTADINPTPLALGAEYVTLFGAITALTGQKVFYTIELIDSTTGQRSLIASGNSTIVA